MRYVLERGLKYTPNAGDLALRAGDRSTTTAIRRWIGPRTFALRSARKRQCTSRSKRLLDPARDELLIVEPCFPSYQKMAALEGIALRSVAMREEEDFAFDPERIAGGDRRADAGDRDLLALQSDRSSHLGGAGARSSFAAVERRGRRTDLVGSRRDLPRANLRRRCRRARPALSAYDRHELVEQEQCAYRFAARLAVGPEFGSSRRRSKFTPGRPRAPIPSRSASPARLQNARRIARACGVVPRAARERSWRHSVQSGPIRYRPMARFTSACAPGGRRSLEAAHELIERYDVVAIPGIAFGPSMEGWLRLSWVSSAESVATGLARIAQYCASDPVSP